jgi:hypothetical protein
MPSAIIVPKLVGGPYQVVGLTSAGAGEATVLIDVVGHSNPFASSGNGVLLATVAAGLAINVGGGANGTSNRCLIATVLFGSQNGGTSTVTSMIWDQPSANQSMTLIPGAKTSNGATGGDIEMWYLMAPAIGDLSLKVNWTGSNQCAFGLVSFVNVDQTGGATSFPTVQTSTASGKTINISTSPTTRKLVGGFNSGSNFTAATDNEIGKNNSMSIFAVANEYAPGTNTLVSYGGGGTGCSLAIAIKGA